MIISRFFSEGVRIIIINADLKQFSMTLTYVNLMKDVVLNDYFEQVIS